MSAITPDCSRCQLCCKQVDSSFNARYSVVVRIARRTLLVTHPVVHPVKHHYASGTTFVRDRRIRVPDRNGTEVHEE